MFAPASHKFTLNISKPVRSISAVRKRVNLMPSWYFISADGLRLLSAASGSVVLELSTTNTVLCCLMFRTLLI